MGREGGGRWGDGSVLDVCVSMCVFGHDEPMRLLVQNMCVHMHRTGTP